MTIFTQARVRQGGYLEEYESGLGESIGASFGEAMTFNPTPSLFRSGELTAAEEGPLNFPTSAALSVLGAIYPPAGAYAIAQGPGLPDFFRGEPDSPVVDAETARTRIKDEGLDLTVPDSGIRSRALDILIDRKREERRRNDVLNRGPSGTTAGALRLGTMLGASALDPLNIASAFVPVIPEARYAALLARSTGAFGRAGVRASVGAVEGAAGAALVEPLVYGAAQQEQADYGLADSLLNIALGTALGGGLHVGVGAVGDWRTARASRDAPVPRLLESVGHGVREQALRTGVAQAVSGRAIDIEPIISYEAKQGFEEPLRASFGPAEVPDIARLPKLDREHFQSWFGESKIVDGSGNPLVVYHGTKSAFDKFDIKKTGASDDGLVGKGFYFTYNPEEASGYALNEQFGKGSAPNVVPVYVSLKNPFVIRQGVLPDGRKIQDLHKGGINSKGGAAVRKLAEDAGNDGVVFTNTEGAVRHVVAFRPEQIKSVFTDWRVDRSGEHASINNIDVQSRASASFAPEAMRLYDGEAIRISDERIAEAPPDETMPEVSLQEIIEDVQRVTASLDDPELVTRELGEFDELAKTAADYGKAVQAAAGCRLSRGA